MVQLVDIFAKPMVSLLRELIHTFAENGNAFEPESVFLDVQGSVKRAHPQFHKAVTEEPERCKIDTSLQNDSRNHFETSFQVLGAGSGHGTLLGQAQV